MADVPTGDVKPFKMQGRYCVIIPAFNAARTIGPLIRQIKPQGLAPVVIDDGSQDRTAAVASAEGALVISHLRNEGKGTALRTGFQYALRSSFDGVVTMDSDGQHDPGEIASLIRAGEVQHAGIVLGNRMANGAAMPRGRRVTNALMSSIISAMARQAIPDSQCGFRFIRREVLQAVPLRAQRFEIETELLLGATAQRWKIVSVPVRSIYPAAHRSHIHPVWDGLRFLGLVLRHLVIHR
ncbi:MAG: glycosyltransferase family 2 protein [Candidatus Omnitrophica bacterium]|nr:glycosyltransferase family 2 protein [Candidatus Omnitrophota bacterium]